MPRRTRLALALAALGTACGCSPSAGDATQDARGSEDSSESDASSGEVTTGDGDGNGDGDEGGELVSEVASGATVEVRVHWTNGSGEPLQVGVGFVRQDHVLCAALGTQFDGLVVEGTRGTATLRLPKLALLAGTFRLVGYLFDRDGLHRFHERVASQDLVVNNATKEVGLVRLDHAWDLASSKGDTTDRADDGREAAA